MTIPPKDTLNDVQNEGEGGGGEVCCLSSLGRHVPHHFPLATTTTPASSTCKHITTGRDLSSGRREGRSGGDTGWGEDKGEDMKRRVKGHVHIKRCLQLVCLFMETVFPLSAVLA